MSDGEGTLTIRGKVILSLVAVACAGAAWLYLSPETLGKVQQLVGMKQVAASDKAATDKLVWIARNEQNSQLKRRAINALSRNSDPTIRQALQDIVER